MKITAGLFSYFDIISSLCVIWFFPFEKGWSRPVDVTTKIRHYTDLPRMNNEESKTTIIKSLAQLGGLYQNIATHEEKQALL